MASRAAPAVTGAARGSANSGTSVILRSISGARLTGINRRTVPATVGVNTRRNAAIFQPRPNCTSDDMTIRVASNAGPPASSALTLTGRKADVLPITRM